MGSFTGATVQLVDYDFTDIPRPDGKGMCKGKGVVPGQTKAEWEEYQEIVRHTQTESMKMLPKGTDPNNLTIDQARELMEAADRSVGSRLEEELYEATVKVCKGSPTREELEELPYVHRQGFCIWLTQELNAPKFSAASRPPSAATNGSNTTLSAKI